MDQKEENVEYHIEIQNCEEGGESGNGEVMYVLDLGGADIPENIAMQLAQLAADGSLNFGAGTNSIMVQNDGSGGDTQVMQIEKDGVMEAEDAAQQVFHLQMGDNNEYLTTDSSGALVQPMTGISFADDYLPVEKSIMGKSKSKAMNAVSLLDRGGKIERTPKASGVGRPKTSSILQGGRFDQQLGHTGKSSKSLTVPDVKEKKSKGDKLPIYPYFKGKTPVMLTVAEDGQVIQEGEHPVVVKSEPMADMSSASSSDTKTPIILDFSSEKSKLDILLAGIDPSSKAQPSIASEEQSTVSLTIAADTPSTEELSQNAADTSIVEDVEMQPKDLITPKAEHAESTVSDNVEPATLQYGTIRPKEESPSHCETAPEDPEATEDLEELMPPTDSATALPQEKCEYEDCNFEASNTLDLAHHLESVHEDALPFICFECNKRFRLKVSFVIHELVHQKDARPAKKKRGPYGARHKFYECPLCPVKKKLKHAIHLHAKDDHDMDKSSIFTCEACKFLCFSEEELQTHNENISHTSDRRSYCDICNQTFTNIYQHKAAVHSDARPFLCNQCGYSAKTKSSLRYHMVIHLQTKDWSCTQCPYKSSSERRLKRHMKTHDPNKKHKCSECSFATHDAYEYKRHFTKVHSRVKSYNCKFCDLKFNKHHEIRLHLMFEHECNDAFFCNYCDFTCATRADYKGHIQVHYGKNKHVCEICGFTGRYRTHYRRHMLTHTANKPFTCKICFKSVREASNLKRHMLTHSEDKPLVCSVCGYRCKIRSRLMNHMKTHSELRPFACHLCKYTTKFNGNLMKHLENHAHYKPHKCQFCSYACNEKNKLRRHMNFRHKGLATEPKKEPDEQTCEAEKELVMLPSEEQYLIVPKEDLDKIVSVDENGTVITADNGTIIVAADDPAMSEGVLEEKHIIISNEDGGVVSGLKDRTILATLEIDGKNVETLVTLKEDDIGESSLTG